MIEPLPADNDANIVGGDAFITYGPESPVNESVLVRAVISKLIGAAFAAAKPSAAVIEAEIVHVPAVTKTTSPELESMVHTDVFELEYDFVPFPFPKLAVAVIVGGVALNAYGAPE